MTWILATIAAVMSTQVAEETITLAPKNCRVTAYENAAELATVQSGEVKRIALKLSQSTNVVALLTEAGEARERAFVRVTFASLKDMPDECGPWLAGSPNAAGWLTSAEPPPGFRPVQVHQSQLEVPAGQCAFRQLIAKPPAAPPWFPKMDVAYAVLGTRQLIKPYLPDLGIPFAYDYQLVLGLPEGIRPAACDGGVGAKPNAIQTVAVGKRVFANLHYSDPPGSPFGIYICWGDSNKATISYQPVLHIGGTYNWRRLSAAVTAPPNAAYAHPIVLKWAGDKVVGEAWIDNVVLRAADDETKQNLLSAGDFEGEVWKGVGAIEKAGPDGSHCLHATLPADRIGETRGWWIPPEVKTPVAGGKNYVLEADVRAERVHVPGSRPHAAVLVACAHGTPLGESQAIIQGASTLAGARTLPIVARVRVLPGLLGRRPRTVRIMPCYYGDPFTDPSVIQAYAENAYRSGVNWTYGRADCQLARMLLPRGHKVVYAFGSQPFEVGPQTQELLKNQPDLQALWFDGKRRPNVACPTWFLGPDGAAAREELQQRVTAPLAGGLYAGFDWDIEQPVVDPPSFCVCQRCIEAFRKSAGIAADAELTPEALLKPPLRDQWVQFRCAQNAELVKLVAQWVKQAQPNIEFSVYSGYQSKWTMEHYGVDWRLLAPLLDAGMSGYGFSPEAEKATMEALGGKPYLAGELYYLSPTSDEQPAPVPDTWAVRILRQVAYTGGHGVVIWYLPVFDGATFYLTSLAADVIARHEPFFTQGQHCEDQFTVDGLEQGSWFALQWKRQALVLLLNFTAQDVEVKLRSYRWQIPATVRVPAYRPATVIADPRPAGEEPHPPGNG